MDRRIKPGKFIIFKSWAIHPAKYQDEKYDAVSEKHVLFVEE